jgi:iron-regulated transporter 1
LLPIIILLSGFVSLSRAASSISIENDWIVVISGSNIDYLSALNVKLRRVNLVARMIAPAVAGYFLGNQLKMNDVFIAMGGLAVISFLIKYKCLKRICSIAPVLVMQRGDDISQTEEQIQIQDKNEEQKHCTSCSMIGGYVIYFQQKISMGGLGFALLYLNVMSSGSIMTSYLIWRGLEMSHLGIVRGASEVFGLVGTIAFAWASASIYAEDNNSCLYWIHGTVFVCIRLWNILCTRRQQNISLDAYSWSCSQQSWPLGK